MRPLLVWHVAMLLPFSPWNVPATLTRVSPCDRQQAAAVAAAAEGRERENQSVVVKVCNPFESIIYTQVP
jgi:hypothetical protein